MKRLSILICTLAIGLIGIGFLARPTFAASTSSKGQACQAIGEIMGSAANCETGGTSTTEINSKVNKVISTLSIVVGIIAIIMIIVYGLKFITSGGDTQKVSSAKKGLVYAIIGLFLALIAQFLVQFVLNSTSPAATPTVTNSTVPAHVQNITHL